MHREGGTGSPPPEHWTKFSRILRIQKCNHFTESFREFRETFPGWFFFGRGANILPKKRKHFGNSPSSWIISANIISWLTDAEEIVNVPPFAKFVQCAVLILVYTFTQTLTYCCLAFRPLTIYEGSVHEQQRLAFIPDIVWFGEDGEHKTMMAWSVACLLLWVVSTPLILCLFIFGGDRVLPTVLRGASGRFLKAHYRPGKQAFELVYMFRRIALTCAAILITNETGELAAINGILFLSGVLHFWQRPFKKWTHNYLEAASVMLLFFLYDTQVYLSAFVGPETEDSVTTLLDVVEVLGFVLIFPFIVSDMGSMLRRWCGCCCGRKNRKEHQDRQRSSVADERKGGTALELSSRVADERKGGTLELSDRSLNIGCVDAAGEKKSDSNNTATADNNSMAAAAAAEGKNKQDDTDTDTTNVDEAAARSTSNPFGSRGQTDTVVMNPACFVAQGRSAETEAAVAAGRLQ